MDEIIYRTARGMAAEGAPFRGTLFAGLMIKDGKVGASSGRRRMRRRQSRAGQGGRAVERAEGPGVGLQAGACMGWDCGSRPSGPFTTLHSNLYPSYHSMLHSAY